MMAHATAGRLRWRGMEKNEKDPATVSSPNAMCVGAVIV